MINQFLVVGIGGMLGTMLRYGASLLIRSPGMPLATFIVNIIGSFVIGLVLGGALKNPSFDAQWRLFLATGLCGGFTTFSAFTAEGIQLLQQQRYSTFLLYFAISILTGLGATWLGLVLTR